MPGLITESCIWAYPKEDSFKKSLNFIRRNKESFLEDSKNLSNYLREKKNLKVIKGMYKDFNNEELSPYLKTVQEYEDEVDSLLDDLI
jgi:Ni,Fe-hydrogenase III large subunit